MKISKVDIYIFKNEPTRTLLNLFRIVRREGWQRIAYGPYIEGRVWPCLKTVIPLHRGSLHYRVLIKWLRRSYVQTRFLRMSRKLSQFHEQSGCLKFAFHTSKREVETWFRQRSGQDQVFLRLFTEYKLWPLKRCFTFFFVKHVYSILIF